MIRMYRLYINQDLYPEIYDRLENMSRALRGDFIRDAITHFMVTDGYPGKTAPAEKATPGAVMPADVVRKIAGTKKNKAEA